MKEFGAALRMAREKAGLTLRELYDRTRINPKHLEALEAGNIPGLPQTYVRAFLRDYAREVGLDEEAVLARYNELAEQAKGIAPPPPPPDTSALIPKMDDTIEIVAAVESEQVAPSENEVTPQRAVAQTREQEPVDPSDTAPQSTVAQRTTPESAPESPPPPPKDENQLEFFPPRRIELDTTKKPEESEEPKAKESGEAEEHHKGLLNILLSSEAADAEKKKAQGKPPRPTRVYDTRPIPPSDPEYGETVKARAKEEKAPRTKKPPFKSRTPEAQRRARIAAWLIVIIVGVTLYAVVEFGGKKEVEALSKVDSAQIAAQMRAKSFVDSSQFVIPQEAAAPQETTTQKNPKEEVAMEPVKQVFAAEDSLVLEAFSNSSVWFAIRMDTTRSERGSLGANDHRIWKAKDRFVVTLGDAGAVTFMLNGTDLGALGDAGSVAKNVPISRANLRK